MGLSRRELLLGVLGGTAVAACAPVVTSSPSVASPTPVPRLPRAITWQPGPGEVSPAAKQRAVHMLEVAGRWTGSHGALPDARERLVRSGYRGSLAESLTPLIGSGSSAVANIRHAHYGGIYDTIASVLVIVDQWRAMPDGSVHAGGTSIDVRLEKVTGQWRVVDAIPAVIAHHAPSLTPTARHVLTNPRIRLPFTARADVAAGHIHDSVLAMLGAMATDHLIDVAILKSGHPYYVFGTGRRSDHPVGRAADLWAIDHHDIVRPANRDVTAAAMRRAAQLGAYQVGGPVELNGSGFFSDNTHQDHIHAGFRI